MLGKKALLHHQARLERINRCIEREGEMTTRATLCSSNDNIGEVLAHRTHGVIGVMRSTAGHPSISTQGAHEPSPQSSIGSGDEGDE